MTWQAAEAALWEVMEEGSWSQAAACAQVTWQAAEAAFWEIVEEGEEPVEVLYGADLDTNALGSGFPRHGGRLGDSPYAAAPWNLNNLPAAAGEHGSMLRHLGDDVPGVTARGAQPFQGLWRRCMCRVGLNPSQSMPRHLGNDVPGVTARPPSLPGFRV